MLTFLYQQDKAVAAFVAALIPWCYRGFADDIKTIGVLDEEGCLIGGLIYHNWNPDDGVIEITGAAISRRWLTRSVIARMYQYPFHELGCQMVIQRLPADDTRQLRMLGAYGYTLTKIERLFGRNRDGVVATLTDDAWANNRFNARLKHHLQPLEEAA